MYSCLVSIYFNWTAVMGGGVSEPCTLGLVAEWMGVMLLSCCWLCSTVSFTSYLFGRSSSLTNELTVIEARSKHIILCTSPQEFQILMFCNCSSRNHSFCTFSFLFAKYPVTIVMTKDTCNYLKTKVTDNFTLTLWVWYLQIVNLWIFNKLLLKDLRISKISKYLFCFKVKILCK